MNMLSIMCIVLGVFAILGRGPMIFAPQAVINAFKKFIESDLRMRIFGLFLAGMGVATVYAAWGNTHTVARVMMVIGSLMAFFTLLFLVAVPSLYRQIADMIFKVNMITFRVIGVLGVGVGILFIYLGVVVAR